MSFYNIKISYVKPNLHILQNIWARECEFWLIGREVCLEDWRCFLFADGVLRTGGRKGQFIFWQNGTDKDIRMSKLEQGCHQISGYPKKCWRNLSQNFFVLTFCHFCVVLYKHSLEVRNLLCPISASMPTSVWFFVSLHVCQCLPGCGPCGPKKALAGCLAGDLCPQWIKHSLSALDDRSACQHPPPPPHPTPDDRSACQHPPPPPRPTPASHDSPFFLTSEHGSHAGSWQWERAVFIVLKFWTYPTSVSWEAKFSLLSSRTGLTVRIRDVFLPSGLGSVCKNSEHLSGASHRSHRRLQLPDGTFPDFTSASQLPLTWVCNCRYPSFMPYPTLTWWARPGFVCNSLQSHQEFLFHNVSFRDGAFGQAWPLSSHFMPLPHTTLPSDKFSLNLRKY